jgi:hypothetical protein
MRAECAELDVTAALADDAATDWRLLFWSTQAAFFMIMLFAVSMVFPTLRDEPLPGESIVGLVAVRMVCLVVIAALLFRTYRVPALTQLRGLWLVVMVLAACLAAALFDLLLFRLTVWWLIPASLGFVDRYSLAAVVGRSFVCLVWTAVYFLLEQRASLREKGRQAAAAELRAARAEVALRESELERLGQQIEPHFLFNALSAVLACRHDPDAVEVVTSALSDYLRFCLSRGNKPEPLAYELDAVEQLLVVQEARLDEDLHCSVASAPTARQTEVPPLVLAPLVDNALKYAFKTSPAPWKVAITARVAADRLVIEVANSGQWVKPDPARPGLGLANLRRRLELHGIDHALDFATGGGLVTAQLSLPLASA